MNNAVMPDTYTAEELITELTEQRRNALRTTKTYYIADCRMFSWFVAEVTLVDMQCNYEVGCVNAPVFRFRAGDDYECERRAEDVYRTYDKAAAVADKLRAEAAKRFGGKRVFDKMRTDLPGFVYRAQHGLL